MLVDDLFKSTLQGKDILAAS